jgi:hypothetical protein
MRMTDEIAHRIFVGIEQLAVDHRIQFSVEPEIEKPVEGSLPLLRANWETLPDRWCLACFTSMIVMCSRLR